jgi:hypothetical protein
VKKQPTGYTDAMSLLFFQLGSSQQNGTQNVSKEERFFFPFWTSFFNFLNFIAKFGQTFLWMITISNTSQNWKNKRKIKYEIPHVVRDEYAFGPSTPK